MDRLKKLNTGIVVTNYNKPRPSVHYPDEKFLDYIKCFSPLPK